MAGRLLAPLLAARLLAPLLATAPTPPVAPIRMSYRPDLCLDLLNGDGSNGNQVQIWRCDGYDNQLWQFDGTQIIYAGGLQEPKCVDADSMVNGEGLTIWDCNGLAQQQWTYNANSQLVMSQMPSLCFGTDGNTKDGTPVRTMECDAVWTQWWSLAAVPPSPPPPPPPPTPPSDKGHALAMAAHPDFCVDAAGGGTGDGTLLQLWKCLGAASQKWLLQDDALVSAADPTMCVDAGPTMSRGFGLMLWSCNGYPQQSWGYDADGGTLYLSQSAAVHDATFCMDIPGSYAVNGNYLWVWDCYGGDGQKFSLLDSEAEASEIL